MTAIEGKSFVKFCIGNTGSYVTPDDRQKIFHFRYTTKKIKGTGLGLANVLRVVHSVGGSIWCESDRERGTEFFFTMPAAGFSMTTQIPPQKSEEQYTPPRQAKHGMPRHVLIVDDEPEFAYVTAYLLGHVDSSLKIETCNDAEAALARARAHAPDIIVCDIELGPRSIDGHGLVRSLRELGLRSFIHLHSNRMRADDEPRARAAGADSFALKPFTMEIAARILGPGDVTNLGVTKAPRPC